MVGSLEFMFDELHVSYQFYDNYGYIIATIDDLNLSTTCLGALSKYLCVKFQALINTHNQNDFFNINYNFIV